MPASVRAADIRPRDDGDRLRSVPRRRRREDVHGHTRSERPFTSRRSEGSHGDKIFTALKKSPIMQESILCGQCHGLGPNFDLPNPTQCATLYGSYLHNYVASTNGTPETCQDCHMKHFKTGHTMPGYRNPEVAKNAVSVDVDAKGYQALYKAGEHIPTAVVVVKMTSNAGHRIPDG